MKNRFDTQPKATPHSSPLTPHVRSGSILFSYLLLLTEIDTWFAACLAAAPPGTLACRQGCSACCRGLFDITLLDAFLLKAGFAQLSDATREQVLARCRPRLAELQQRWPQLQSPYLLNTLPDDSWQAMPEDDATPCPLLGDDDLCLVYPYRPMTCRLHGLPNIDRSGDDFSTDLCTRHPGDPHTLSPAVLYGPFRDIFTREIELFRNFTTQLTDRPLAELDTFIPLALLADYAGVDWRKI